MVLLPLLATGNASWYRREIEKRLNLQRKRLAIATVVADS
jgi:hypothetical protein